MINTHKMKNITYPMAAIAALLISGSIQASTVIYEDIGIVESEKHKFSYKFENFKIAESGKFQVTLSDFEFPRPFKHLGLTITNSTDKYAEIWGNDSMIFSAEAGDYYIGLVYKTKRRWDLGMYGIEINQIGFVQDQVPAVPVPAAAPLFLSGLVGLGLFQRRKKTIK